MLREQFNNGRLDGAASKAEILEELCEKLNFDPDAAASLHTQLYREKLTSVVADKKISGDLGFLPESHLPSLKGRSRLQSSIGLMGICSAESWMCGSDSKRCAEGRGVRFSHLL